MIKSPTRQYTLSWLCWWSPPSLLCHIDIKKRLSMSSLIVCCKCICRGVWDVMRPGVCWQRRITALPATHSRQEKLKCPLYATNTTFDWRGNFQNDIFLYSIADSFTYFEYHILQLPVMTRDLILPASIWHCPRPYHHCCPHRKTLQPSNTSRVGCDNVHHQLYYDT